MREARFQIAACSPERVALLRRELAVSAPLAQVLVRRGLDDPARASAFLAAEEEHPPGAFAGIERAVEPLLAHVLARERITVHGDYDVDGICATAVLVRALRGLGAEVDFYLPDRASDGYGLNERTVRRLAARGTRLLLTADCAITAVEQVALAQELGMTAIVSDHHAPHADGRLPQAPIVHPAVCGYPCPELCATAVAHKLAQALLDAYARRAGSAQERERCEQARARLREDLDLVALATIADLVPLVGENRTLARRGLRALAGTAKVGLRALMWVAGVNPARVDERAVGFALAPRLNAAGRLYRADAGLELILTEDAERARAIAAELDAANRERRAVELRIRMQAEAELRQQGARAAYVLAGEEWHAGVVGIVASRLVEQSGRPVVLIALEGETGRGSGRSIEAFDLLGGLSACSEHLLRYGGHSAAAGLEIERGCIEPFAVALAEHAERALRGQDLVRVERVDAVVEGHELGLALAEELQALAPHGQGNPKPSLMVARARLLDMRPMGEGKHVRFNVQAGSSRARAVAFGTGGRLPVADGEPARATFTLEVNEWNGVTEPRLVLRHAEPRVAPPPAVPGESATPEGREGELVLFALP